MIKLVFDRPNTRVLVQGKGFDVLVLRTVLLGLCQVEEVLFEVTSLLDWIQPEPTVQEFFDFILKTTEGNPTKLKDLFTFAVFTPTHIILPEHKQKLLAEINSCFSVHELSLSTTEEEIEFNYSELSLAVPDSPAFLKLGTLCSPGGYFLDVLLHRPDLLADVSPSQLNPHLVEYLAASPIAEDQAKKKKVIALLLIQLENKLGSEQDFAATLDWTVRSSLP